MKSKKKTSISVLRVHNAFWAAFLWVVLLSAPLAQAQTPSRFVGTITAVSGNTLTVKTGQGQAYQVEVPATVAIKRIAPGQRDLSAAQTIQLSDLAVGDRALVMLDPNAPAGTSVALRIVAIKQEDVARKQQMEREDWQQRGVGGLVKSVDPTTGVIVVTSGAGPLAKTITVHTTQATSFKRYAPDSVRFDEARPAPINAIHVGDQLRARGAKNEDGTEIAADEVVSGSFRNISGMIVAMDAKSSTLTVKDLATKKVVIVHVTEDTQMRRLPDRMALLLAALLKGSAPGGGQNGWNAGAHSSSGAGGRQGEGANGQGEAWNHSGQSGGLQGVLDRAPEIHLADLQKGEAVMLVSTDGKTAGEKTAERKTEVTAITLLAGVAPLLESPEASNDLLSSWSMNSGAGTSDEAQ